MGLKRSLMTTDLLKITEVVQDVSIHRSSSVVYQDLQIETYCATKCVHAVICSKNSFSFQRYCYTTINLYRCITNKLACFFILSLTVQPMRSITCQVSALWEARGSIHVAAPDFEQVYPTWCPWDHIHPHPKGGGYTPPMYNPGGKYCVRLHWMVSRWLVVVHSTC